MILQILSLIKQRATFYRWRYNLIAGLMLVLLAPIFTQNYQVEIIPSQLKKVDQIVLSSNGKYLLSHEIGQQSALKIWNEFFILKKTIPLIKGKAKQIAIASNGQLIAFTSSKSTIEIWDVEIEELLITLQSTLDVRVLRFHPNSKQVAVSGALLPDTPRYYDYQGFNPNPKRYPAYIELFDLSKVKSEKQVTKETITYNGLQCSIMDYSSDGKYLLAAQCQKSAPNLLVWEVANKKNIVTKMIPLNKKGVHAQFIPDSDKLVYNTSSRYHTLNVKTGAELPTVQKPSLRTDFSINAAQHILSSTKDGFELWNKKTGTLKWRKQSKENPKKNLLHPNELLTYILTEKGTIEVWNQEIKKHLFTLYITSSPNGYVLLTSQGYYFGSKEGVQALYVKQGNQVFTFEQFDVLLNRPDKIFELLPNKTKELTAFYENLTKERLRWIGGATAMESETQVLPQVRIRKDSNHWSQKTIQQNKGKIHLMLEISALRTSSILHVLVNKVPLFGFKGKKISNKTKLLEDVPIQLSHGKNLIEVKVSNQNGQSSPTREMTLTYKKEHFIQNLYFIGIGVSQYKNVGKVKGLTNLSFAHQDVLDIGEFLQNTTPSDFSLSTHILINERATQAEILSIKEIVSRVGVDDIVLLYLSGHGRQNGIGEWCFTPFDYFEQAGVSSGISDSILAEIMDSSPSRKKVIMIDACNSGEFFTKQPYQKNNSDIAYEPANGSAKGVIKVGNTSEEKVSLAIIKSIFNDLRIETGTIIIAASRGEELAGERWQLENGAFTHCFLQALNHIVADQNSDRNLSVSELMIYIHEEVLQLTQGMQTPNFKRKHVGLDFTLWKRSRKKVNYKALFKN